MTTLKDTVRKYEVTRKEFPWKKSAITAQHSLQFLMKGTRVFKIEECELDLLKHKNNEHENKLKEDLKGATEKCEAQIAQVERVCDVDAAEANDLFAKVNT